MEMPQSELDRLIFFEHARKAAEAAYAKNPLDAENLTRWGGALLELSQFQNGPDSVKCVEDAISKLEEALAVVPRKHDTMWCLGNAHTSLAFYTPDHEVAKTYLAKATRCFEQALEEDSRNELYLKSLDLSFKAPELHLELHRQINSQQASHGTSSSLNGKATCCRFIQRELNLATSKEQPEPRKKKKKKKKKKSRGERDPFLLARPDNN